METSNRSLAACGECGSDRVTLLRTDRGDRAQARCRDCGAFGPECTGAHALDAAECAWNRRPPARRVPRPAAAAPLLPARAPRGGEAWSDERDPLELMARLLVGGVYRVPVAGRSTVATLGSGDIAAAVAYMRDPVEKATALAVATRADAAAIGRLAALAYRLVYRQIRAQRPRPLVLSDPADRWRLRLVIYDAAYEMVWPERRRPYSELARAAKMRKVLYMQTHKCATAALQAALNTGRREFRSRLFAP
ncbi:hypothetical protein [Xanthomonas theicola]|uniref:Uncharacterized protein n=2 Tax=Xanthomonas theicola TaxID=56464 RepID=A0A2S6ZM25_9XANT|nr:hypothetical protein [Xanthomonas theicola]PPT93256.1 hypothetical protein XthCFBP4691_01200 [Xanthomonas theicola]QNH24807.1 hypothetical protein G4Q83_08690 [Xanthomonas theicola]